MSEADSEQAVEGVMTPHNGTSHPACSISLFIECLIGHTLFAEWLGDGELLMPTRSQLAVLDFDFGGTFGAVESPTKHWVKMYAGQFPRRESESDFYSETQCSGDDYWLIAEEDLDARWISNMVNVLSAGRWSCRANYYESHWFRLDMLLNGPETFVPGPPKQLTISKHGLMVITLQHPASDEAFSHPDVEVYLKAVSDSTFVSHQLVNCVQA
ncbi:hypothetical protein M422DRAFT_52960 [Sphaerobolus stellatus SS14]|uniref:Uncharacterized protein n=1 Tax=Sphaerobolus stellatus (strain SS14) TaxID=990650 RepID=A0A0C9V444_SPHS4|nr:hypothetical protein M422DRAFT_52960 [Sphaerobolus stellatus SS14]